MPSIRAVSVYAISQRVFYRAGCNLLKSAFAVASESILKSVGSSDSIAVGTENERQVRRLDPLARAKKRDPLHQVPQFADVSGARDGDESA